MVTKTTLAVVCLHIPAVFGRMFTTDVLGSLRKGTYYDQPLKNHEDVSYSASISIGGQTVDAILDSGSFDLEVVSSRCGLSCAGKAASKYYNRAHSHTYVEGDLIQLTRYESGDVLAQSATDKVEVGPLVVSKQEFWEVVHAELPILEYGDFQAILGVGPPGVDQQEIDAVADLADEMTAKFREQGLQVPANFSALRYREEMPHQQTLLENLDMHSFSVCLERQSGALGHFVWNDRSAMGKAGLFRDVPVAGEFTWSSRMTGVSLGGTGKSVEACEKACAAIIDSGTSLVMVPTAVYNRIYDHLHDLDANCDRLDDLPHLVFNLGGLAFELPPSAYIGFVDEESASLDINHTNAVGFGISPRQAFRRSSVQAHSDGKVCNLLLGKIDASTQIGDMWILGMPFFRSYYVNFQLGENLRGTGARKMSIASASERCSPTAGFELDALAPTITPTYVNWKRLQIPRWAKKAHARGKMVI